jgi:hypothetical protein
MLLLGRKQTFEAFNHDLKLKAGDTAARTPTPHGV